MLKDGGQGLFVSTFGFAFFPSWRQNDHQDLWIAHQDLWRLTASTEKDIPFPSNFNTKSQNGFHWVDLGYNTILSQPLKRAGFTFLAGVVAPHKETAVLS